jgi:hypothetical protein
MSVNRRTLDRTPPDPQSATDDLARVARSLLAHVDELADRTVRRIVSQVPALNGDGTVPLRDLWRSVAANVRGALVMLAEQRGPSAAELAGWADLGRRRAQQGIQLDDLMRGLRVTNTVLWEVLTEAALRADAGCAQAILEQAGAVWETFDVISCHVGSAHRAVASEEDVRGRRAGLELLAALRRPPEESEQAAKLARGLGLDPNAFFVIVIQGRGGSVPHERTAVAIELPEQTVAIVQVAEASDAAEHAIADRWRTGAARVGVGVARGGLAGAHLSLLDAEMAYHAAVELEIDVVRFRDSWLECLALATRDQHELLVGPAIESLRADPSIRATLRSFLTHDGSLAATADHLGLHANTVAYRVRQLAERTGLDARTTIGSALAQVALALTGSTETAVAEVAS